MQGAGGEAGVAQAGEGAGAEEAEDAAVAPLRRRRRRGHGQEVGKVLGHGEVVVLKKGGRGGKGARKKGEFCKF